MLVIRMPIGLKKIRSVLVRLAIEVLECNVTLRSCVEYVHSLLRQGSLDPFYGLIVQIEAMLERFFLCIETYTSEPGH